VQMLIWFTFRDSPGNPWKSGVLTAAGRPKPSLAAYTAAARGLTTRNEQLPVTAGSVHTVRLPVLGIAYYSGPGAPVGLTYTVLLDGHTVAAGKTAAEVQPDGSVTLRVRSRLRAGERYVLKVAGSDVHGNELAETRTLVASG
jgi:hypothetical protein